MGPQGAAATGHTEQAALLAGPASGARPVKVEGAAGLVPQGGALQQPRPMPWPHLQQEPPPQRQHSWPGMEPAGEAAEHGIEHSGGQQLLLQPRGVHEPRRCGPMRAAAQAARAAMPWRARGLWFADDGGCEEEEEEGQEEDSSEEAGGKGDGQDRTFVMSSEEEG